MPVQFLPPTKLQLKVLDHFVEEQGFGSGVHKLYRRLKTLFDGLIHPKRRLKRRTLDLERTLLAYEQRMLATT